MKDISNRGERGGGGGGGKRNYGFIDHLFFAKTWERNLCGRNIR